MKKLLTILCLVLALCMACGLALAEEPEEVEAPETRVIEFVDAEGHKTGESVTVTKTEIKDDDGNVIAVKWLDAEGRDWGDVTIFVVGEHDFTIDDKSNPTATEGVSVIYPPTEEHSGILRVHCHNHPDDDLDVKEYTIYYQNHEWPSAKLVKRAINAGRFNETFPGFVAYDPPVCAEEKDGTATVKCICDSNVHWEDGRGFVGHKANCAEEKTYTIKFGHVWSDENKEIADPYHDLVHPTCTEPGQVVGYCLVCGLNKNEVLGDDVIVGVLPLFHHKLINNAPAWVVKVKEAPNCKDSGITTLWCTECNDWISDADCAKLFADGEEDLYPIITEPNGEHVRTEFLFDAWKVDENGKEMKQTCTQEGECFGHYICVKCHMVFGTEEAKYPALGHNFEGVEWTPVNEEDVPTCTDGVDKQKVCKLCHGAEEGGIITPEDPDDKFFDPYYHFDAATNQSALVLQSIEREATCTEDGIAKYFCTKCNQIVFEVIPKLNHKRNGESQWVSKTYTGWCGGAEAVTPDESMVGTSSYTYDQCELCQAIKNITETAKHEHTYTEWQLRNKFAANDDGSVAVPEYWVRYCSNNYPLDESIKCAHHQDYICDFALYELELTPPADYDGVSAPVKPGEEAEDPEDPETVPAKDKYDLTSVSLNPDLAVITYAPVEGKTITNLRVEAYMLGQGTTYFAINLRVMSDGGDLQFPMNGAFGFAFRLYDADTGETVDEVSKFFID